MAEIITHAVNLLITGGVLSSPQNETLTQFWEGELTYSINLVALVHIKDVLSQRERERERRILEIFLHSKAFDAFLDFGHHVYCFCSIIVFENLHLICIQDRLNKLPGRKKCLKTGSFQTPS